MKNLDLNAYGVTEMTQQEMKEANGGGWLSWVGAALVGFGMITGNLLAVGAGLVLGLVDKEESGEV